MHFKIIYTKSMHQLIENKAFKKKKNRENFLSNLILKY